MKQERSTKLEKQAIEVNEFVIKDEAAWQSSLGALEAYTREDVPEVHAFVRSRPYLSSTLREAPQRIHQFFPTASLSLKVVCDPEEGGVGQLVLSVHVDLPGRVALQTLKKFDTEWWLHRSRGVRDAMEITLEW